MGYAEGESIGGEIERLDALTLAWLQHSLSPGKTVLID